MKRKVLFCSFFTFLMFFESTSAQVVVSGIKLIDSLSLPNDSTLLVLNGAGVRNRYSTDMYVLALYIPAKCKLDKKIVDADQPTVLKIHIISSEYTLDRMEESIRDGFDRSLLGRTVKYRKEIDMIISLLKADAPKVGDVFEIYYLPETGLTAKKNGIDFQVVIPGIGFKKALIGIWLGRYPIDLPLKEALLGLTLKE